jgi:hypothetical protein
MKAENNSKMVTCKNCKFWKEEGKSGWGTCREVKNIGVLGGVWWPEKNFGCINGAAKNFTRNEK